MNALRIPFVLALLILSACATPPAPKYFDDHVAAMRTAITLTNDTASVMFNGGHIT
jgi:hypothetical protein